MPVPAAFTLIITVITGTAAVIYSLIEQKDFLKLNHRNILLPNPAAACNFGRMCVRTYDKFDGNWSEFGPNI